MANGEKSFRYAWHVRSLEHLKREMASAVSCHGRIGTCGWYLDFVSGNPLVLWDEARRLTGFRYLDREGKVVG